MKYLVLFLVGLSACYAQAAESNYVFEIDIASKDLKADYRVEGPLHRVSSDRCRVFVTEAQYNAGYAALNTNIVTAAIGEAKTDLADFEQWSDRRLKALLKALAKKFSITKDQMKALLKAEM